MIIFDLDNILADCEHRQHFVTPPEKCKHIFTDSTPYKNGCILTGHYQYENGDKWQPDWQAFYEACDQDKPILPVVFQFYALRQKFGICHPIQIWSGRCESVKGKTIDWLQKHFTRDIDWVNNLKMRPIGDYTPDEQLKEHWLDERIEDMGNQIVHDIQFVFDSDPDSIKMWRRRGIFVFDCNQTRQEF